jgi:DNA uptake protein ComE-like DNA-binding protein
VDINRADPEAFDALPGIGAAMAKRAVRFRESLGGFYAVHQFSELWGLDSAVYALLQPHLRCSGELRPLVLNRSPLDSLKAHPYLAPWVAQRIVDYREAHGAFLTLDEVQRVRGMNDSVFFRVRPYLRLD